MCARHCDKKCLNAHIESSRSRAEYLQVAAELYYRENYFPALSLAAMAEEIFEAVLLARRKGSDHHSGALTFAGQGWRSPISEDLISHLVKTFDVKHGRIRKERFIRELLYRVKNSAKHGKSKDGRRFDLSIDADVQLETCATLGRAVENYIRLGHEPLGDLRRFYREYLTGGRQGPGTQ